MAILSVLVSHFAFQGKSWTGEFGVLLFFVLSGSLMGNLLFIKQVRFKEFFFRRLSRVMPVFVLFVLTMAVVTNYVLKSSFTVSASELAATLLFLRTYLPGDSSIWQTHWPIGHIWSLNIEEHSYIVLAIVAFICRNSKRKWLPVALLLTCTFSVFATGLYYALRPPAGASPWELRSECASFGLICAATFRVIRSRDSSWEPHPVLPVFAIAIAVACFLYSTPYRLEKTLAPLCLAFSLVYLDRAPALLKDVLSLDVLRKFGIWSFSLYIWQQPFFALLGKYQFNPALMALAAISVGVTSFYLYEDRLREYLNQAWAIRQTRFLQPRGLPDSSAL